MKFLHGIGVSSDQGEVLTTTIRFRGSEEPARELLGRFIGRLGDPEILEDSPDEMVLRGSFEPRDVDEFMLAQMRFEEDEGRAVQELEMSEELGRRVTITDAEIGSGWINYL